MFKDSVTCLSIGVRCVDRFLDLSPMFLYTVHYKWVGGRSFLDFLPVFPPPLVCTPGSLTHVNPAGSSFPAGNTFQAVVHALSGT